MTDHDAPEHPRLQLDEHLSLPARLSIAAALARVDDAVFPTKRDAVQLADVPDVRHPVRSRRLPDCEQAHRRPVP